MSCDETGLTMDMTDNKKDRANKSVTVRGRKCELIAKKSSYRFSAIGGITASAQGLPPMLIFPGTSFTLGQAMGGPKSSTGLPATFHDNRFGPPRPPVAILSPPCRLPVAVLALSAPCRSPVACLSLPCRCLVAPCRSPVASLWLSCRPPVAILSLPVASCRFLSPCYFLPGAFLSLSSRSPVVPSCRSPVAISCCLPVALLSLACRLPAATLSPPCRLPVASLSPNMVTCRSPVACLSLACRLPVVFLPPPCRLPVVSLSPPCRPTW